LVFVVVVATATAAAWLIDDVSTMNFEAGLHGLRKFRHTIFVLFLCSTIENFWFYTPTTLTILSIHLRLDKRDDVRRWRRKVSF
jgi:hypothetical protein